MTIQLPLFEMKKPQAARITITGAAASEQMELPAIKLDQTVLVLCRATVTSVTHKRMKDDGIERQHVVVIDPESIELGTVDDYVAVAGLLWDRLQLRDNERFGHTGDVEVTGDQLTIDDVVTGPDSIDPAFVPLAITAGPSDDDIEDAEIVEDESADSDEVSTS
jgi:hypothetical protein